MKPMKKMYCNYKFCNCPNRALPKIKQDKDYKNWKRTMHKCCYFEFSEDGFNPEDKIINPLN